MGERWVNAVATIRIPLDVPVNASKEEKLQAACDTVDSLVGLYRSPFGSGEISVVTFEDVEDGEPIK